MKEQLIEKLKAEILHIFESGANEIRVLNMVEAFINKYYEYEALTSVKSENNSEAMKEHAINFYFHCEDDEITDKKVQIIDILYRDYLTTLNNN